MNSFTAHLCARRLPKRPIDDKNKINFVQPWNCLGCECEIDGILVAFVFYQITHLFVLLWHVREEFGFV